MNDIDDYKRNKKIIVRGGILLILVIITLIIIMFFGKSNNSTVKKSLSSDKYLIIGNSLVWNKIKNNWYQANSTVLNIQNDITIYNGLTKTIAKTYDYMDNKWSFYDVNNNIVSNNNFRIAYTGLENIRPAEYTVEEYDVNDDEILENIVSSDSEEDLEIYRTSLKKVNFDFDNDGYDETLYTFTDYLFGNGDRTPYSYIALIKNGEVKKVIKESDENVFEIIEILDTNDDNNFEIVISKGAVLELSFDSCYQIYNIKNNNLKLTQDCKFIKE